MMNPLRFLLLATAPVAFAACSKDATFVETNPPQAALHWVNAVADTSALDMRPIDIVTNAGLFSATFRSSNTYYQGIDAGTHRIRIFVHDSSPTIAGVPIFDSTVAFAGSSGYTAIYAGFARTGSSPAAGFRVIPDDPPAPGAGEIGYRVVNAGAGLGAVDVNFVRHAADTLPDVPQIANLAYLAGSTYTLAARDSAGADSLRVVVTAAGTKTPRLVNLKLPTGVAGDSLSNPIAGSRVIGSVITAIIVSASVVGSKAPQGGAFAAPSAVFLVDRRPANTVK
jgi:Domain of unknown function (DUF4397)